MTFNRKTLVYTLLIITTIVILYGCHSKVTISQPNIPLIPPIINSTTTVGVAPKTSATDNDVELTQVYKASINGATVEVPVETKENIKGVIKQEIDMTKVIQQQMALQRELDRKEFKKNWELGVGIGVHDGDTYVPIEIQRNYKVDKAISAEIHLDADELIKGQLKVTGGEIKHKWML